MLLKKYLLKIFIVSDIFVLLHAQIAVAKRDSSQTSGCHFVFHLLEGFLSRKFTLLTEIG